MIILSYITAAILTLAGCHLILATNIPWPVLALYIILLIFAIALYTINTQKDQ